MDVAAVNAPILVGVDFSEGARRATRWATRLAARLDVPLILVHVVHDPGDAPGSYHDAGVTTRSGTLEETGRHLLERFVRELGDTPVDTRVVVGLPATRLIEVAKEVDAQLLVIGSRGRSGIKRLLLGSTASKVVQLARLPVTVVPTPKKKGKKGRG